MGTSSAACIKHSSLSGNYATQDDSQRTVDVCKALAVQNRSFTLRDLFQTMMILGGYFAVPNRLLLGFLDI